MVFSSGWDIQDRRNFVFIKPKSYESNFAVDELGGQLIKMIIDPNQMIENKSYCTYK